MKLLLREKNVGKWGLEAVRPDKFSDVTTPYPGIENPIEVPQ
jgi:hypothetical protein